MIRIACACLFILTLVRGNVLDPSIYLSPGPPLLPSSGDLTPAERWNQEVENRVERDTELLVVPLEEKEDIKATTKPEEAMESSETFWRGYSAPSISIHGLPLTFNLAGNYGRYAPSIGTGVVANKYVIGNVPGSLKSTFAGSGYGSYPGGYATRIYGGNSGSSWSGWGNGKWGHYGKG